MEKKRYWKAERIWTNGKVTLEAILGLLGRVTIIIYVLLNLKEKRTFSSLDSTAPIFLLPYFSHGSVDKRKFIFMDFGISADSPSPFLFCLLLVHNFYH